MDSKPYSDIKTDASHIPPALEKIEDMLLSFLSQLSLSAPDAGGLFNPSDSPITSKCGSRGASKALKKLTIDLAGRNNKSSSGLRSIKFPRKSAKGSMKPFAQLFRVLDISHEALSQGIPVTKRDVFYNDVSLFQNQRVVDKLVDDVAATFELERRDLSIRASSKGLVCGAGLVMHLRSGESIQCTKAEGTIIPPPEDIIHLEVTDHLAWVLLIEKEAVFQRLCHFQFTSCPSLPGAGLILTGKGYPDVATRSLVKILADNLPNSIPIMALVDCDPYGIDIMSVYKYGSQSLSHENDSLAAGRVKWLGVWASEIESLGIDPESLLPITQMDMKKATSMLERSPSVMPKRWRRELSHILNSGCKAEIEILSSIKKFEQSNIESDSDILMEGVIPDNTMENTSSTPGLLQYLVEKVTDFVQSAQEREDSIAEDVIL